MIPGPGSIVLSQNPDHPMSGEVIATPEGHVDPDGWIWVRWSNHLECAEYPSDVILTGQLNLID